MARLDVAQTVRSLRDLRAMSSRELARRAGCSEGTIRRIEGGQVSPGLGILRNVLDALNADEQTRSALLESSP